MLDKIKEMVAENLGVDAATITEESSFKDDLGADSLDLFELVMAVWKKNLESRFRRKIWSRLRQ